MPVKTSENGTSYREQLFNVQLVDPPLTPHPHHNLLRPRPLHQDCGLSN